MPNFTLLTTSTWIYQSEDTYSPQRLQITIQCTEASHTGTTPRLENTYWYHIYIFRLYEITMSRVCYVELCRNNKYKLNKWRYNKCEIHGVDHTQPECVCEPPFRYLVLLHTVNNVQ